MRSIASFTGDRYDYRRAPSGFARDLNSDLDVVPLKPGDSVKAIVETLVVDRMALMLPTSAWAISGPSATLGFVRKPAAITRASSIIARPRRGFHTVAIDDPIAAPDLQQRKWSSGATRDIIITSCLAFAMAWRIAVIALAGRKSDETVNSEDLALLTGRGRDRSNRDLSF